MYFAISSGVLIPFIGTVLGAACVFFIRKEPSQKFCDMIKSFAAGVMIAAAVWSLLIPAMEHESAKALGRLAFLPALAGFWLGVVFLLVADAFLDLETPFSIHRKLQSRLGDRTMLFLSVTLHNIPEGMAVGVVYALYALSPSSEALMGALILSLGIAVQNFPEGAIISLPLRDKKRGRRAAFLWGALSGIVEPLSAVMTLFALSVVVKALPLLLGFAAGAMVFAVIRELLPSSDGASGTYCGVLSFGMGFSFMMVLDVVFG